MANHLNPAFNRDIIGAANLELTPSQVAELRHSHARLVEENSSLRSRLQVSQAANLDLESQLFAALASNSHAA